MDFWYLDDGDILCVPALVRPFLESFDVANDSVDEVPVHAERNRVKSEVIYYVDESTLAEHAESWGIAAVQELASVSTADVGQMTLGVATGPVEALRRQLAQKAKVVEAMHEKVAICADVQTEHVLCRQSLRVGRVNHILRVQGHDLALEHAPLDAFDSLAKETMDRLFPGLEPEGYQQASLAASLGGLGWRSAADVARPAHLAALVMATPKVHSMAGAAVRAGLLPEGRIEALLAERTAEVEAAYLRGLDEREKSRAEEFIQKVKRSAAEQWRRLQGGSGGEQVQAPRIDATFVDDGVPAAPHDGSVDDGGDGGRADHENASRRLASPHVQKELMRLQDCTRLRALESRLRMQCNWGQLERLKDLRHPEMSHRWLWHLDSTAGSVMNQADYVLDVQKHLGCRILECEAHCHPCGVPLDSRLEATRGHYACVRALVEGFRLADPGVTTEPRGLTSTMARPADILTNAAVPGRGAALDICIASPNAASALGDAAAAAFRRKLRRYRRVIPELARAGIAFRPLVWTSEGRPHPAVTRTLRYAAGIAATRSGSQASSAGLMGRWRHEVQIAIQRRRAAMARAVLPRATARQLWLLTGNSARPPSSLHREPPLDDGGDESGEDLVVDEAGGDEVTEAPADGGVQRPRGYDGDAGVHDRPEPHA